MKLNALPRRDAQRFVGIALGQFIEAKVLVSRHPAAGNLAADHEHVILAEAARTPRLARVTVLLLICAMELEQILVAVTEVIDFFGKVVRDAAAQETAVFLLKFHGGSGRLGGLLGGHDESFFGVAMSLESSLRR